nr:MAG TPA: hypothetical protein [Caudoviricetes sp.]DAS91541.1 MAG TPA: hypothetical protein [Caudoviricetes sp.]
MYCCEFIQGAYIRELMLLQQPVFDLLLLPGTPTSRSFIIVSTRPPSRGYLYSINYELIFLTVLSYEMLYPGIRKP